MSKSSQHPGVIVKTLIDEYRLTPAKVAKDLALSYSSLRLLLSGKLRVSAPVALRLSKYFEKPVQYWIDLQNQFELADASADAELSAVLKKIPKAKKEEAPKVSRKAGNARAEKPPARAGKTSGRAAKPSAAAEEPFAKAEKPPARAGKTSGRAAKPPAAAEEPSAKAENPPAVAEESSVKAAKTSRRAKGKKPAPDA
jgi:addiction module HigA family antidote